MDFDFPVEQQELAEALGRRLAARPRGEPAWRAIVELGVPGLAVAEAHGGFGGGTVDLYLALHGLGRQRAASPLWGTAVAARVIAWAGSAQLQAEWLPAIARGELQLALAVGERGLRHELLPVGVTGSAVDGGAAVSLQGDKSPVAFAESADAWLVSARVDGQTRLLLVPRGTPGTSLRPYRSFDGQPAADLCLNHARVAAGCVLKGDGEALLGRLADCAAALLCAEAVGLMECARDTTLDYLKTRRQFGSPLSAFQALQHRMVDMLIHLEQARSMALLAVAHADDDDVVERTRNVAAAKALMGEAARFVGQQSVQLHGAIGLTEACVVSGVLKRLTAIDLTFGDTDHHLARLADLQVQETTA